MLPNVHYNYVLGIFVTMSIFVVNAAFLLRKGAGAN